MRAALLFTACLLTSPDELDIRTVISTDSSSLILLDRGESPAEALVVGYKEASLSRLSEAPGAWRSCSSRGLASKQALSIDSAPDNPGIAVLGRREPLQLQSTSAVGPQIALARQMLMEIAGEEVNIRSLIKIRRAGAPPAYIAVGEAGCRGFAAVLDLSSRRELSHLELELPGKSCAPLAASSPFDLDEDGSQELILRAGDGAPDEGIFRALVELEESSLQVRWSESIPVLCLR